MQFKNWGILSLVIIAASIFYYLVIFLPEKENNRLKQIELERTVEQNQRILDRQYLENCLNDVENKRKEHWNELCKKKGLEKECLQPLSLVELENKRAENARDICFKKFK